MPLALNAGSLLVFCLWRPFLASALEAHNLRSSSNDGITWTLKWFLQTEDGRRGAAQSSFQVELSSASLRDFDTGKVASQEPFTEIPFEALAPHAIYTWRVRLWDEQGKGSNWSSVQSLVTPPSNWTAPWITQQNVQQDTKTTLLRGELFVQEFPAQAVVSVSGLGHYELTVNGHRVGDRQMDAGWTQYKSTCLFSTYDVTSLLHEGVNGLGAFLGNGMYNNVATPGRYQKWQGFAGLRTLSLQITLRYANGSVAHSAADTSWQGHDGPITFNSIYGGEDYDARLEITAWDSPPFQAPGWTLVSLYAGPGCSLRPQLQPPVKIREVVQPAKMFRYNNTKVIDFGTEFAGWPVITVQGFAGSHIRLTPAEKLDSSGLVWQGPNFGPAYWTYTLRGGAQEVWRPRFFTYGFRYLQVEAVARLDPSSYRFITSAASPEVYFEEIAKGEKHHVPSCSMCYEPCKSLVVVTRTYIEKLSNGTEFTCSMVPGADLPPFNVTGEFVYSSADIIGNFSCSNPIFNSIHNMILGAMKSNLQSIFHDCPHRERLGWLEQAWLLRASVAANFDVSGLYAKIVHDIAEAQLTNGMVPDIAPEYTIFSGPFRDSPEWGLAMVILPMFLYDHYKDVGTLRHFYTNMSSYIDYLASKADDGIVAYGLGDWTSIGDISPLGVTATMVFYEGLQTMSRAAELLGKPQDQQRFRKLANKAAASYNARWFNSSHGGYVNSQTATAMALALDISPNAKQSMHWLVQSISKSGNHSLCGEIGWPYIVRALADGKEDGVLASIVSNPGKPGYVYQLTQGATTLTESWVADRGQSWNHAMDGHVDEWFFYRHVAGFRSTHPLVLAPQPYPGIEHATASRVTNSGVIALHWEKALTFRVNVTIPPGTSAHLLLPMHASLITENGEAIADSDHVQIMLAGASDSAHLQILSGTFSFEMPIPGHAFEKLFV